MPPPPLAPLDRSVSSRKGLLCAFPPCSNIAWLLCFLKQKSYFVPPPTSCIAWLLCSFGLCCPSPSLVSLCFSHNKNSYVVPSPPSCIAWPLCFFQKLAAVVGLLYPPSCRSMAVVSFLQQKGLLRAGLQRVRLRSWRATVVVEAIRPLRCSRLV